MQATMRSYSLSTVYVHELPRIVGNVLGNEIGKVSIADETYSCALLLSNEKVQSQISRYCLNVRFIQIGQWEHGLSQCRLRDLAKEECLVFE